MKTTAFALACLPAAAAFGQCLPEQTQTLTGGQNFGQRVSVSQDTAAILEDGAARVYVQGGSPWQWTEDLVIPGPAGALDVCRTSNSRLVLLGDPSYVPPGSGSPKGRALLYKRLGTWSLAATFNPPPGEPAGWGSTVAVAPQVAVVARAGVVDVHRLTEENWAFHQRLSGPESGAFGHSVDLDGNTMAVGAPYDEGGTPQTGKGAVYIYLGNGWNNTWYQFARISAPNPVAGRAFGASVAVSDWNLLVGEAPFDASAPAYGGAVYLYRRTPDQGYILEQVLTPIEPLGPSDRYGASVGLAGSLALAGAPFHQSGGTTGTAWLFRREGNVWNQQARMLPPAPGPFASNVAVGSGRFLVAGAAPEGGTVYSYNFNCPSPCYADCNGDGTLSLADFGCYMTKFALGDTYGDCNQDIQRNLADFGCFATKFAVGCP